jgi:translocation and assembly module TamB
VTFTPTQLTVRNLDLVNGAQRFSISGDLNLEDAKAAANNEAAAAPPVATPSATPTALTLEVEHVDLGQLDDLLLGNRGFKGTLDAKAAVSGSLAAPLADASFTVSKGAAQTFTYDQLTATVHHDGSGAKVDLRLDQSPDAWVNVNAAVPALSVWRDQDARRTAPLSAHLTTSTIDLGLVQMFTTAVKEVTGTAHADLTASGTIGNPELSGSLSIDGGGFLVNETDTRFRGLQAAIRLHDDQIGIDTLHVLDEAGHPFNLTGTVAFAEKRVGSVDVRIDAQDFQVIKSKLGEMSLDVDGTVTGAMPALAIRTNVNVRQGRIEVDRVMEQLGGPTYATESQPIDTASLNAQPPPASPTAPVPAPTTPSASGSSEAAQPSLFDALTLDARLRIPNNLVLRGDDVKTSEGGLSVGNLNLTVGGDIHATKAANDRPVVVGSIRTVRGFYEFKGRRFDLQRDGTVSFKGPDPTDPTLDVTGIREISGIEARVRVHGTAKRPAIDISSTPPLDEADVLSLIVFNRPVNELGEGEQTSVAQTAATMVGNFAAAPLAEALRNALDVDLLEVSAGGDSGTGPSVAIGNQIGEKVFFKVKQEFGSADVTEFLLDYQLTDLLRLQTTAAQGAQTNRTPGHRVEPAALDFVFVKKY